MTSFNQKLLMIMLTFVKKIPVWFQVFENRKMLIIFDRMMAHKKHRLDWNLTHDSEEDGADGEGVEQQLGQVRGPDDRERGLFRSGFFPGLLGSELVTPTSVSRSAGLTIGFVVVVVVLKVKRLNECLQAKASRNTLTNPLVLGFFRLFQFRIAVNLFLLGVRFT